MGTALHAACSGGHLSAVHILLQAGAQLDVLNRDQNTPLMLAAVSNHNDVVKYLVKAGANVMLKVRYYLYLLHNCCDKIATVTVMIHCRSYFCDTVLQ